MTLPAPDGEGREALRQRLLRSPLGGLSTHILPTSATMVGVCMTVLSIVHLGRHDDAREVIDKLLATDAVVFVASSLLSFLSMRSCRPNSRLESRAELVFVAGLGILALVAVGLAFAFR